MDGADTILEKGDHDRYIPELGMSVEQAIDVWEKAGKPVIHLYPGENCFGLDTLLSRNDILPRHLLAVRDWLSEQTAKV
ncbi:MAG: hypothetical protein FJ110_19370 [Deltaproteobacteria bacterium]|nr:hypothetical protein [Deltaproteobacteria bacterium]